MDVFVSVGTGLNSDQEAFVVAIEERLRAEGFTPRTVGRNTFSTETPLKAVTALMDQCNGTVVIALERYFFSSGLERRRSNREKELSNTSFPTSWNQIEATMAYCRDHPLLVLVDQSIKPDGLLEPGNDWFVQRLPITPSTLNTAEFNGVFADWRNRVKARRDNRQNKTAKTLSSPADMTIVDLLGSLRPGQAWNAAAAIATLIAGSFLLGAKLVG